MGFDNSVFMSIEDARALADSAAEVGVSFPADLNSLVSNIMVDAEDGVRTDILVSDINKAIKGEGRAQDADTIIFSIGD